MVQVSQRAMKRAMAELRNDKIRSVTKLRDIIIRVKKSKMRRVGGIARMADNRWASKILERYPREVKTPKGRPFTRKDVFIRKRVGSKW